MNRYQLVLEVRGHKKLNLNQNKIQLKIVNNCYCNMTSCLDWKKGFAICFWPEDCAGCIAFGAAFGAAFEADAGGTAEEIRGGVAFAPPPSNPPTSKASGSKCHKTKGCHVSHISFTASRNVHAFLEPGGCVMNKNKGQVPAVCMSKAPPQRFHNLSHPWLPCFFSTFPAIRPNAGRQPDELYENPVTIRTCRTWPMFCITTCAGTLLRVTISSICKLNKHNVCVCNSDCPRHRLPLNIIYLQISIIILYFISIYEANQPESLQAKLAAKGVSLTEHLEVYWSA